MTLLVLGFLSRLVMYECVYVACLVGIFSKLRSLNLLSAPFDEQQFFVTEDEFDQTNPSTGDLREARRSPCKTQQNRTERAVYLNASFLLLD